MKTLKAQEVKDIMDNNKDVTLAMVLSEQAFKKAHIPDSINMSDIESALNKLPLNSKIIVYCSDIKCTASLLAYQLLESAGYKNIWRFAGGLLEWEEMGFPLVKNQ